MKQKIDNQYQIKVEDLASLLAHLLANALAAFALSARRSPTWPPTESPPTKWDEARPAEWWRSTWCYAEITASTP
jgi:hypothetical protein